MKISNVFGKTVISVAVFAAFGGAYAAPSGRASMMPNVTSTARMPVMPTVSLNTIGNPAVTTVVAPVNTNSTVSVTPTPAPQPQPQPQPQPTPSNCPDGGVANSTYTVSMCMNDVLQCVNTGALQGGLHDLFNYDVRNSIMNGMRLCQTPVDKCIREVRVDCHKVYNESSDVWLDFNSRIVQPEYYNFVLRKTGLTPNQAENTCLLLDRNTYGTSFAAVSDMNAVNTEYNQTVGAYNGSNGNSLTKDNPQGVMVNTTGYDGNRGHYARWDATNGECLVRVAAYNKNKLITNSWLFGAVGDETPAEVWRKAGSTFTCSKDLFDMSSLMNQTKTAAVIAVPGGAVLGTAIGAGAGAAAYKKKHQEYLDQDFCADANHRKELALKIKTNSNITGVLRSYAYKNVTVGQDHKVSGDPIFGSDSEIDKSIMSEDECRDLYGLAEKVYLYESKLEECINDAKNKLIAAKVKQSLPNLNEKNTTETFSLNGDGMYADTVLICGITSEISTADLNNYLEKCTFAPLRDEEYTGSTDVYCEHNGKCIDYNQIKWQIDELMALLKKLDITPDVLQDANKGKEIGKGAGIGLAVGAAAGGLATAITALVEKNNITCKVGDGLNSVSLGKSHTIDSLKDFYVKWNLHLPDVVSPTSAVTDMPSWQQACGQFNNRISDCPNVQINFKKNNNSYELINSACKVSGSVCVADETVAQSHGVQVQ